MLVTLLPFSILISYLLFTMHSMNDSFNRISRSVTYANTYAIEFKERMDYSMYLAVVRGEHVSELETGTVSVNGVKIVNPYSYMDELREAGNVMAEIATAGKNKSVPYRIQNTLGSLEKRIKEIDDNIDITGKYDMNMRMLDENIYSLTSTIQEALQDYINVENAHFDEVRQEIQMQNNRAFQICILISGLVIALVIPLSIKSARSVTVPIKKLCDMTKLVAKGDFTARTTVKSQDEVATLMDNFNDMTVKIGHLVDRIQKEQENLRIVESKLLQAQINPHFLYNTLDTIVWLAEAKQTEDVVKMVTHLSEFFRTTLSKGKDFITLAEERRHVESYLQIQQFRYQDIMTYEIRMEEEILKYSVPKLMLQPLVENALYHGIKNKRGGGTILIEGKKQGNIISLKVIDNGKGMSREELEELRRYVMGCEDSSEKGFGLSNVNERIHHYYGPEYGLFFESEENVGTEAAIIIPAKNIEQKS